MESIKYLLLFAAITLVGCQVSDEEDSLIGKRKNKVEEVAYARAFKVGVTPTMDCLPIFLLKDSNLYNPDNIDIRLKEYSSQLNAERTCTGFGYRPYSGGIPERGKAYRTRLYDRDKRHLAALGITAIGRKKARRLGQQDYRFDLQLHNAVPHNTRFLWPRHIFKVLWVAD